MPMEEPLDPPRLLIEFGDRVTDYLRRVGRPHLLETWVTPEREAGLHLHVETPEPGLALDYWVRPVHEPDAWWLAVDHESSPVPTRFALRTARLFPGEESVALRRIEHLVIAQAVVVGRDL